MAKSNKKKKNNSSNEANLHQKSSNSLKRIAYKSATLADGKTNSESDKSSRDSGPRLKIKKSI